MMPPTISSLRAIDRFSTAAEALEAAREIVDVPTILPRVIAYDGGVRIVLPGDPDYDGPSGVEGAVEHHGDWMQLVDHSRVTGFSNGADS